jgi:hypothetical protein
MCPFIQEKLFYRAENPFEWNHDGIEPMHFEIFLREIKKAVYKKHKQPGMLFSSDVDRIPKYFHATTALNVNRIMVSFSFEQWDKAKIFTGFSFPVPPVLTEQEAMPNPRLRGSSRCSLYQKFLPVQGW